jgi:hemoglobin/transferrin/lactoferrin receptor protein
LNSINPLKAVFGLHWQPDNSDLSASLRIQHLGHQSRVDFSDGSFFVPPSATVLDLALRWAPTSNMDWRLGIYNLTDQRYWRYANVRRFDAGDPRVDIASLPGLHAALTVDVRL